MRRSNLVVAMALAIALAAPAVAVQYKFVVKDATLRQNNAPLDGDMFTFYFASSPSVDIFDAESFSLNGSAYYSAGVFGSYRADGRFTFYNNGFGIDTPLSTYFSEPLFTGQTSAPTFRLGRFDLDDGLSSITITTDDGESSGAAPEPSSWAMMIAGFGLTGIGLRVRRTRIRFAG